jgi:MFS family permease
MVRPREASPTLWHHRDFRRLWAGDSVSQLGFSVGTLALPYLAVTQLHATKFEMGVLSALAGIGFLLVGLPAGAIVDRYPKRTIMIIADLGRAALLLTLPIAWWCGALTLAQVLVVATAVGVLSVFFDVSYQSYLPLLVEPGQVVDGNAKLQMSQSVSQAAGPAVSGLLLSRIGAAWVVGLNGLGYLWSALCLRSITHRETTRAAGEHPPLRSQILVGLRFILRHRLLRRLVACTGLGNFFGSAIGALIVLYEVRELRFSALTIGVVDSAAAAGGFLGALAVTRLARIIGEGPTLVLTAALMSLSQFAYPLASVLPAVPTLVVGGAVLMGVVVAYNVATVSFRQRLCPPELLGRMNASARFLVWGTIPLGALLGGALGAWLGVLPTMWLVAGLALTNVLPVATPALWRLRVLSGPETVAVAVDPAAPSAAVEQPDGSDAGGRRGPD